jgi:nicotinamide-nucleotide amidase
VGVAVTGIAGPDGGTLEKPVGLAYLGLAIQGSVWVETLHSVGDRKTVKEQTANKALNALRLRLSQWRPASSRP